MKNLLFFYLINIANCFVFPRYVIIKKIKYNDNDFTTEWDFYNQTYKK